MAHFTVQVGLDIRGGANDLRSFARRRRCCPSRRGSVPTGRIPFRSCEWFAASTAAAAPQIDESGGGGGARDVLPLRLPPPPPPPTTTTLIYDES